MRGMNRLRILQILLLAIALALVGCDSADSASDNVTFVVVTGETPEAVNVVGQAQATTPAPPTFTPPPATPTPDVAPEVMLQVGNRYLLNGYYENAVESFQNLLLVETISDDTRASALFNMGRAALRAGLFGTAVDTFNRLIQQFPGDFRAHQSLFLRGDAYLGVSNWEAAIADFQQYLAMRPGWIDSWVHERIGDAQLALGQYDAALASYDLATEANRSLVPQLALRERVAQVYLSGGNVDEAVNQYDAILAVAQNSPYRADIEFRTAQALLDAGRTDMGLARMRRVFTEYQAQAPALEAMNILLANGAQLDSYVMAKVYYFANEFQSAIESFNTFTTQAGLDQIPAELYLLLGRAYRAVGNDPAARVAFQTIIEQYPGDPLFGEALLEQGRTSFLAEDIDDAITRYLAIAQNYPTLESTAAQAMWRAGYLHGTNGRPDESRAIFEQLAQRYPNSDEAESGLNIAASAAVNAGDTNGALTLFNQLASTTTGTDQASAYLWVGRLALERGDTQTAENAFQQANAAAPDSYFSARANDLLIGRDPFTPPTEYVFEFDDLADIATAEEWLRTTFGITEASPLWPLSSELEDDPRIRRGRELWTMGLFDAAETEFFDILETYESDPLNSYRLSVFLMGVGAFYPSQVGAANVIIRSGVSTLDAPSYIARLRYPAYYQDVIRRVGEERDIDPLLMMSLIRHESLFDTNATAAAGEKGLTQVIPGTGEYIAQQLAWQDYQHSDLFRPYAGIEFGAFYLGEQLNRFDGNTYAALAGYNAGPGRAISWLELSGGDPDLFMATITISTTQLYIQRIYSHYNIYRELYGNG